MVAKYITKLSPTWTWHTKDGEIHQAVDGVLTLSDAHAKELEDLRASGKRPDLFQAVVMIDEEAAKELVRQFRASQAPTAHAGTVSAQVSAEHKARDVNRDVMKDILKPNAQPGAMDASNSTTTAPATPPVTETQGNVTQPGGQPNPKPSILNGLGKKAE